MPKRGQRAAWAAMFEAIKDAAAIFELDGDDLRIVAANPAFAATFRSTPEQLHGELAVTLYRPNEYADVLEHVQAALKLQEAVSYEAVRELPSGRRVIDATMVPASERQVIVLKRDISKEQEALRRLGEIESLANIGMWQWNVATDAVTWSDQYRQILDFPVGTAPTMASIIDAVHPEDRQRVTGLMQGITTGRDEPRQMTYRIVRPGGEVRYVETRGSVAFGDKGELVRMYGTIQDITELHLAERREQQLERVRHRQRQAAELNDDVVQGLAAAWLALELGETDQAMEIIQRTSQNAQRHVSDLIRSTTDGPVASGVLARRHASNADAAAPSK